jgi:hypothetical protein
MRQIPLITFVLSVHNDLRFLPAAVDSMLGQTFEQFEAILIDDGSTDGSGAYLDSLIDPRVRVIHNPGNLGLTTSLNIGLDLARSPYIARMDADDICEPDRLARQIEFLDSHPDVGILGTSRQLIDEEGREIVVASATQGDLAIRWKCLLGNPFAHPTVMLRRSVLNTHKFRYADSFRSEDYELWIRLLQHTRGENLAEPLLRYRLRAGNDRPSKPEQLVHHDQLALSACQAMIPKLALSSDDIRELRGRYGGFSVREPDMNPADEKWIQTRLKMLEAFTTANADRPDVVTWTAGERVSILSASGVPISHAQLNYRAPIDETSDPKDLAANAGVVGIAIAAALTVFGLVFFWIVQNLNFYPGGRPTWEWKLPGATTAAAVALWSWALYAKRNSRRVWMGALIGFGIGLLIEGACFTFVH